MTANELLFLDNYGITIGYRVYGDTEIIFEDDEYKRVFFSFNEIKCSVLIKGKHRINFNYYNKSDIDSFNFPLKGDYFSLGTDHFIKNKTSLNLNFNLSFKYISDKNNIFSKSIMGFGVSRENESADFPSFSKLTVYFQKPSNNKISYFMQFDYPVHIQVLPKDNTPSNQSYMFVPSIMLDGKDVYFSTEFSISHVF